MKSLIFGILRLVVCVWGSLSVMSMTIGTVLTVFPRLNLIISNSYGRRRVYGDGCAVNQVCVQGGNYERPRREKMKNKKLIPLVGCLALSAVSAALGGPAPIPTYGDGAAAVKVDWRLTDASPARQPDDLIVAGTTWMTPQGERTQFADQVLIMPKASADSYTLDTDTKQVQVMSKAQAVKMAQGLLPLNTINSFAKSSGGNASRRYGTLVGHATVLGYPCGIYQEKIALKQDVISVRTWVAVIGGQEVGLRVRGVLPGGTRAEVDVTAVTVLRQAPAGLLDIPAGYTVVAQQKATP